MAGFIDILIAHHQKNKVRARKLPILKASMAAAAIVFAVLFEYADA